MDSQPRITRRAGEKFDQLTAKSEAKELYTIGRLVLEREDGEPLEAVLRIGIQQLVRGNDLIPPLALRRRRKG